MRKKMNFRSVKRMVVYLALGVFAVTAVSCKKYIPTMKNEKQKVQPTMVPLEGEDVLMSVGKMKVAYEEIAVYVYMLKEQYEAGLGSEIWSYQISEKEDFGDYAKKEIVSQLSELKIIKEKAEELKISLTPEEQEEVSEKVSEFVTGVSKKDREKYGITTERMEQILGEHQLAEKVFAITTNKVDTNITDEEAKQITIQYIEIITDGKDRNGTQVQLKDKEKKMALKKAKQLQKEAKSANNFYSFAEANTDALEVELTFGKEDMPKEFGKEAFAMTTGQVSEVIETANGYYILYCLSDFNQDATKAKKEEIINEKQNVLFQATYTQWSKDYKIEVKQKLWDKIEIYVQ